MVSVETQTNNRDKGVVTDADYTEHMEEDERGTTANTVQAVRSSF